MIKKIFIIFIFILFINHTNANENIMILKLKDGDVVIELFKDIAPNHVKRFQNLANEKKYDGVVFHRVIADFMVQTGDVQFGNSSNVNYDLNRAGTGGYDLPNLKSEFSNDIINNIIKRIFLYKTILPIKGMKYKGASDK